MPKSKKKTYKVSYYFDGIGEQLVKARNKKEAEEKWRVGDIEGEDEWGEDYVIKEINLID